MGDPAFGKRTDLLARYTFLTHKYENDHTDGVVVFVGRGADVNAAVRKTGGSAWSNLFLPPFQSKFCK